MNSKKPQPNTTLTEREHAVARLVAEGHSNKVIAARLMISEHTAKFHVRNLMVKMGAQSRASAAVKYALAQSASVEVQAVA